MLLDAVPQGADPGKYLKLGQRVSKAINDTREHEEEKQLDPQEVLVDHRNRDSAPPNVMYIHVGILNGVEVIGLRPHQAQGGPLHPLRQSRRLGAAPGSQPKVLQPLDAAH